MRAQASLLILAASLAACGPQVRSAAYVPAPEPRQASGMMRIYEHTRPDCAFEEIGRVTGRASLPIHSPDEVANAMRRRAAAMGGDAIIAFGERMEDAGSVVIPVSEQTVAAVDIGSSSHFVGTVIRFTDPSCVAQAPEQA